MTRDAAAADRNREIRDEARAWQRAGVLDPAALAATEAAYPYDRVGVGPVFRALLFLFTLIAVNGGLAAFSIPFISRETMPWKVLLIVAAAGLALLTELLVHRWRRVAGGIEAATSLLALAYGIGGVAWILLDQAGGQERAVLAVVMLLTALATAAAAWRWGYPLYAAVAAAALLVALDSLPYGRLLWIALPLAAALPLVRAGESARLPPSLRAGATAALLTLLCGLYFAVHVGAWDGRLIEALALSGGTWRPDASLAEGSPVRVLLMVATALVPLALLAWGLRTRRRPLWLLGGALAVVSVVTVRFYVHLAPLWTLLCGGGLALLGLAFALRRSLAGGRDGERGGFTALPLFDDAAPHRVLELAVALTALAPGARPLHEPAAGFTGEGGRSGGGGATGEF